MIIQGLDPGRVLVLHVENVGLRRPDATGTNHAVYASKLVYDVGLIQTTRLVGPDGVSLKPCDPESVCYVPWVWLILHKHHP